MMKSKTPMQDAVTLQTSINMMDHRKTGQFEELKQPREYYNSSNYKHNSILPTKIEQEPKVISSKFKQNTQQIELQGIKTSKP